MPERGSHLGRASEAFGTSAFGRLDVSSPRAGSKKGDVATKTKTSSLHLLPISVSRIALFKVDIMSGRVNGLMEAGIEIDAVTSI